LGFQSRFLKVWILWLRAKLPKSTSSRWLPHGGLAGTAAPLAAMPANPGFFITPVGG